MFKSYLKIALRNMIRQKGYSFINVTGLALGIGCCLLIMLWVMDELSYDRFHENAGRLYRIEQDQFYSERTFHVTVTPYPMGQGCKDEIPEIQYATPLPRPGTLLCRYGEKAFFEQNVLAVRRIFVDVHISPDPRRTEQCPPATPLPPDHPRNCREIFWNGRPARQGDNGQ